MDSNQQLEVINHLTAQIRADQIALVRLGVHPPDTSTREATLLSDLSDTMLREQAVTRILGHDGPVRTLPETAQRLVDDLKALKS